MPQMSAYYIKNDLLSSPFCGYYIRMKSKQNILILNRIALCAAAAFAILFAAGCATLPDQKDSAEKSAGEREALRISEQLAGKTWILSGILFNGIFIPMEPAHSAGNVLVFRTDGTFQTTAAASIISGTWKVSAAEKDSEEAKFSSSIKITRTALTGEKEQDRDAELFQQTYLSALEKAAGINAYGDSFMLYASDGSHILSFILNNPAW